MPKLLIIHDRFMFKGGAERLVLILAKAFQADIMTEFWTDESFDKSEAPAKVFVLDKKEPKQIVWRYFRAQYNFLFKTKKIINQYNLVIFSGNNCLTATFNLKKNIKKILYCHHPVRHAFDLWKFNRQQQKSLWKKIIYYDIGAWLIRIIYWLGLSRFKTVIANSKNVQARLKKYLNKESQVIYPPIQTNKFGWLGQNDYYLSFGRMERLKRIPDIVRAFQKMPDKKLIIVSGGPDLEKVKEMAKGYSNIKVVGWVNDEELAKLIGNCIATIYIPMNEDFGMTPLESMSAGKPCIGVKDGGLKETIIDEINGKFIPKDYTMDNLIQAVQWMTPAKAAELNKNCIQQAEKFSQEKFINEVREVIS